MSLANEKTVRLDIDTWTKLQELKLKTRSGSIDQVIQKLLRERKA